MENYQCQIREGGPCGRIATHVIREPYTPNATKVRACSQHAKELIEFGYYTDHQATHELAQVKASVGQS